MKRKIKQIIILSLIVAGCGRIKEQRAYYDRQDTIKIITPDTTFIAIEVKGTIPSTIKTLDGLEIRRLPENAMILSKSDNK